MKVAAKSQDRAVFLDRDGTIIQDVGYPKDPQQVRLLPGAARALATLKQRGFRLVLVSNQSGIGRGLIMPEEAELVHQRVLSLLAERSIVLDAVYYCPHAPEEQCRCRKPSPEMLLQARRALDLDLAGSFMVGDKLSDIEAGKRAGCQTILLTSQPLLLDVASKPDAIASCWSQTVERILNQAE